AKEVSEGIILGVPRVPGFDAYLFAVMPWPAWPDYMDPDFEPGEPAGEPADADVFFGAIRDHFHFLEMAGFEITPPDNWEAADHWAIPFSRSDVVVLIAAVGQRSM